MISTKKKRHKNEQIQVTHFWDPLNKWKKIKREGREIKEESEAIWKEGMGHGTTRDSYNRKEREKRRKRKKNESHPTKRKINRSTAKKKEKRRGKKDLSLLLILFILFIIIMIIIIIYLISCAISEQEHSTWKCHTPQQGNQRGACSHHRRGRSSGSLLGSRCCCRK